MTPCLYECKPTAKILAVGYTHTSVHCQSRAPQSTISDVSYSTWLHWRIQGSNPAMAPIVVLGRELPPPQTAEGIVGRSDHGDQPVLFARFACDYIKNII